MRCTGLKSTCSPRSRWGSSGRPMAGRLCLCRSRPTGRVEAMATTGLGIAGGEGLLIVNSSMVDRAAERSDVRVVMVDAVREATALGDARVANMVLLGAFLATTPVVSPGTGRRGLGGWC